VDPKCEQPTHLVGIEGRRQALSRPGCAHLVRRIAGAEPLAQQVLEEGSYRGQAPLHAARTESPGVFSRRKSAYLGVAESAPRAYRTFLAESRQPRQIVPVGRDGVRAQAPLAGQMCDEPVDPFALAGVHERVSG